MIISASRRTDIPAFYSDWFLNRLGDGYCDVANPFNPGQVKRVSLLPEDVCAFVFWSRYPKPMMKHLEKLDSVGYGYYYLITLLDYPGFLDPKTPSFERRVECFLHLSERIGYSGIVWRYDPIVMMDGMDHDFHCRSFQKIAQRLSGYTDTCLISFLDLYTSVRKRLLTHGIRVRSPFPAEKTRLVHDLAQIAGNYDIRLRICALNHEEYRFSKEEENALSGRCIDPERIFRITGRQVAGSPHKGQRKFCRCVKSIDIGRYSTCRFECRYCYAGSQNRKNQGMHISNDGFGPGK